MCFILLLANIYSLFFSASNSSFSITTSLYFCLYYSHFYLPYCIHLLIYSNFRCKLCIYCENYINFLSFSSITSYIVHDIFVYYFKFYYKLFSNSSTFFYNFLITFYFYNRLLSLSLFNLPYIFPALFYNSPFLIDNC